MKTIALLSIHLAFPALVAASTCPMPYFAAFDAPLPPVLLPAGLAARNRWFCPPRPDPAYWTGALVPKENPVNVYLPTRAWWSSPFCRWQGALAQANSIELAAGSARRFLAQRGIDPRSLDSVVLGHTVPQHRSFYGAPWLAGMIGAGHATGPIVSQACATAPRALLTAALEVEAGLRESVLVVTCDRTSNGPHIYYPDPGGPGGTGEAENPVWDNFGLDPWGGTSMLQTAENVARESKISREEMDDITLLRYEQYQESLRDDRAFQKRYLLGVELGRGKKAITIDADEGIYPTTREGLAGLRPVLEGGTVTFGSQTHPADGNAGALLVSAARLAQIDAGAPFKVQVVAFGDARVEKAMMPTAPVPAARAALQRAGIGFDDLKAIKTHNPFAVNDAYFVRETGVKAERMNRFGSPLIYGHPQGPTGLRAVIELVEELTLAGGGHGLFTGCAAGDTAMALVVKVA